jgi:response regulator RpfG family c-di-GMP phosphodiesterase
MAHILVCDDDDLVRSSLCRILRLGGHSCTLASSAEEALALLGSAGETIDVLLSDYQMPGANGVELLAAAARRAPDVVRMLISGTADFSTACRASQAGAFRILVKPFDPDELLATIGHGAEVRALRRERDHFATELAESNRRLQEQNKALERRVVEHTGAALDGLISALDFRDTETQLHSRRVSRYARRLAEELGLDGQELLDCEQGALLHDIGKIGVRDSVLLKPGPLDEQEWAEMRRHPALGYQILKPMPFLAGAAAVVYSHHERWDGCGYPRQLAGAAIPVGARVFAVVDTYDAMTSDRPYRAALPYAAAAAEIARSSGSQFDPEIAAAFARIAPSEWTRIARQVSEQAEAPPVFVHELVRSA